MGLYDDIQNDIAEAFNDDLSDTVKSVTISKTIVTGYDAAAGEQVSTTQSYETRGIIIQDEESKGSDETMVEGIVNLLILDSEKSIDSFKIGMDIIIDNNIYEIKGLKPDPAGATHTLRCRPKYANS